MNAFAEKIHLIEQLSANPAATNLLLDKAIECLVNNDRRKLEGFREKLASFERQYGMSTADFLRRFDSGELGDAPDWFDWDGYAALAAGLENKLQGVGVLRG